MKRTVPDGFDAPNSKRGKVTVGPVAGEEVLEGPLLVRKFVAGLKKKVKGNIEKRDMHVNEPQLFMESELELYDELTGFKEVATQPECFGTLTQMGAEELLVQLLTHSNTDIVCAVVDVLKELTDPALVDEAEVALGVHQKLASLNIHKHLLSTLDRLLDGAGEDEREGAYSVLGIIENLLETLPGHLDTVDRSTFKYLVSVLFRTIVTPGGFNELKGYAAELIAALIESQKVLLEQMHKITVDKQGLKIGAEKDQLNLIFCLLQSLSHYLKNREGVSEDEAEYIENLYDALCAAMLRKENQQAFEDAMGVKLLLMLILPAKKKKKGKATDAAAKAQKNLQHVLKHSSLRLLMHALQGNKRSAKTFVQNDGLGILFGFLMMMLKGRPEDEQNVLEGHCVGLLYELVKYVDGELLYRIVAKFREDTFQKTDRLVEVFVKSRDRLAAFESETAHKKRHVRDEFLPTAEEEEAERLAAGGLLLRQLSAVLARVAVNDSVKDGVLAHARAQFQLEKLPFGEVLLYLDLFLEENLGGPDESFLKETREKLIAHASQLDQREKKAAE
eukprot:TRINITY_DN16060_c0_g1_i1.p1 TRINITY_DN16060_c0_g1~~TRINITY_DN16060_c0_g1_i1.p1  ORF type:complete len:561 (+),score=255.50 TRINITY_DN16060_c0_g1_i1:63-1745(+)